MEFLFVSSFFVHLEELKRKKKQKFHLASEKITSGAFLENPFFYVRFHFFSGKNLFRRKSRPVLVRKNSFSGRKLEKIPKDGTFSGNNFVLQIRGQDRENWVDKIARVKL